MDTRDLLKILTGGTTQDKTNLFSALASGDVSSLIPFLMNAGRKTADGITHGETTETKLPDDSEIISAMQKLSESADKNV